MDAVKPPVKSQVRAAVDYALVLRNLEKRIAENRDTDSILRIVRRPEFWQRLSPEDALRCARLLQAAGDVATALAVLEGLTSRAPDFTDAWRERVALLEVLGKNAISGGVR